MISYLTNKPVLSLLLSMLGIGLLVAAFLLNPFKSLKAQAIENGVNANCNELGRNYPANPAAVPTKNSYESSWYVTQWLRYDGNNVKEGLADGSHDKAFPIGPSAWLVCGKNLDPNGVMTTYQEAWQLEQVRLASSRLGQGARGQAYNRIGENGFGGNHLEVEEATYNDNNINHDDKAFKNNSDSNWNPVGLYGLLFTSKDDLDLARSYFPSKWSVSGTF
jgi:hypothetical protein